jgi:GH18 family chitinase
MKKNVTHLFSLLMFLGIISCNSANRASNSNEINEDFKVVGYFLPAPQGKSTVASISYQYVTSINFSFAKPAPDNSGNLMPLANPDTLHALVRNAHSHKVEVFISVGGFGIGDGPGIDTRFEVLANRKDTRTNFTHACMNLIREFDLDGIDMDWEFPDPEEPSISNFVSLMKELRDSLKPAGKKLTAAIESHRLPYTYGIDDEVFNLVDWLNIMVYDGEEIGWHRPNLQTSHSPYWLAVESLDYWLDKRGLDKEKVILGVPFYGKGVNRSYYNYRKLLEMGADPEADAFDSIHYNGIKTMKRKVLLAKKRAAGVMIWEISGDTTGQYSLLKAIHDATE